MILTCPACAHELKSVSRFCPRCGSALPSVAPASLPTTYFPPPVDPYAHLRGVGGWLILLAVGLAVAPLLVVRTVLRTDIPILLGRGTWGASLVGGLFLVKNVVTLIALILLNWFFYTTKRIFPKAMIGYYVWTIGTHVLQSLVIVFAHLQTRPYVLARSLWAPILSAAVWIPYFIASRRVKVTFVN